MAIGAEPNTLVTMILRQGMILAGSGVLIGLVMSLAAAKPTAALVEGRGFNLPLVALVAIALLAMAALRRVYPRTAGLTGRSQHRLAARVSSNAKPDAAEQYYDGPPRR